MGMRGPTDGAIATGRICENCACIQSIEIGHSQTATIISHVKDTKAKINQYQFINRPKIVK
jgi:hypothetical protein